MPDVDVTSKFVLPERSAATLTCAASGTVTFSPSGRPTDTEPAAAYVPGPLYGAAVMLAETVTPAATTAPVNDAVYVLPLTVHATGTGAHPDTGRRS